MDQTVRAAPPVRRAGRLIRLMLIGFLVLFVLPLATHAAWWATHNRAWNWSRANWSSSGILPSVASEPDSVVHVLAGRTGGWKGVFAHHTWVVVKPAGAARYTRYDVVGWGRPVRIDNWAPDGNWYSNTPSILVTLRGARAAEAIGQIEMAVADYPYSAPGSYRAWPGPNSNTFVAHIARKVPELAAGLLDRNWQGFRHRPPLLCGPHPERYRRPAPGRRLLRCHGRLGRRGGALVHGGCRGRRRAPSGTEAPRLGPHRPALKALQHRFLLGFSHLRRAEKNHCGGC